MPAGNTFSAMLLLWSSSAFLVDASHLGCSMLWPWCCEDRDISSHPMWQISPQPVLRTEPRHTSGDKTGYVADGEAGTYPGCHQDKSTISPREINTLTKDSALLGSMEQGTWSLQHHIATRWKTGRLSWSTGMHWWQRRSSWWTWSAQSPCTYCQNAVSLFLLQAQWCSFRPCTNAGWWSPRMLSTSLCAKSSSSTGHCIWGHFPTAAEDIVGKQAQVTPKHRCAPQKCLASTGCSNAAPWHGDRRLGPAEWNNHSHSIQLWVKVWHSLIK